MICSFTNFFPQGNLKTLPGSIQEKVVDTVSGKPIAGANIAVFKAGDSMLTRSAATDSKGAFRIDSLAAGSYRVVIGFVGYRSKEKKDILITAEQSNVDMGVIALAVTAGVLANVTVISQPGLIENKIDKLVYNAERDITSQGGVATDILKKIPMVSVDVDGNVDLLGNSNIRFLINGKPSGIFGNNPSKALQSIPASCYIAKFNTHFV